MIRGEAASTVPRTPRGAAMAKRCSSRHVPETGLVMVGEPGQGQQPPCQGEGQIIPDAPLAYVLAPASAPVVPHQAQRQVGSQMLKFSHPCKHFHGHWAAAPPPGHSPLGAQAWHPGGGPWGCG